MTQEGIHSDPKIERTFSRNQRKQKEDRIMEDLVDGQREAISINFIVMADDRERAIRDCANPLLNMYNLGIVRPELQSS